jgi:hypothetical protein
MRAMPQVHPRPTRFAAVAVGRAGFDPQETHRTEKGSEAGTRMPCRDHLLVTAYLPITCIDEFIACQDGGTDIGISKYVIRGFMGQDPDDAILSRI